MMRRLLITGSILSMVLFTRGTAFAADDFTCTSLDGLTGISPYTRAVMDRAENGLGQARQSGASANFLSIMPAWMRSIGSAWAGLIDTTTQRTDAVKELTEVSACLHFDLALMDCKIEEVRQEMHSQSNRGSFVALIRLRSLLNFLNDRRQQLTIGALDPEYPDPTWGNRYIFDPPGLVWCTPQDPIGVCEEIPEETCTARGGLAYQTQVNCEARGIPDAAATGDRGRMCPFDANYAPAFDNGFGCDIETMEPRKAYPPINAELEGLKAVNDALTAYRQAAVEVRDLHNQMNELLGIQSSSASSSSSSSSREHLEAFGCGWMGGWCEEDIAKRCTSDADCLEACVFSDKVCDKNRAIRCTDDSQCDDNGPCIEANEPTLRSLRGNFSLDKDQLTILNEFLGTRSQQEISRVFRDDLKTAAELPESDQAAREARAKEDRSTLMSTTRSAFRTIVQGWSRKQARDESLMYPEDVDASLEAGHALSDLHTNIAALARLAKEKTGLREFVTNYASFLRRSCIYRPCGLRLEQAIRLLTTEECFPYTNGEYLNDDPNDPRWEKCKQKAGIQ